MPYHARTLLDYTMSDEQLKALMFMIGMVLMLTTGIMLFGLIPTLFGFGLCMVVGMLR